jgi:hypothetical protein
MKRMAAMGPGRLAGLLVLLSALAGPAAALQELSGSGRIEDVLLDERLVVVGGLALSVGRQSQLQEGRGRSLTLLELEERVGERAFYRARSGQPHPTLEAIWVDDPASDEVQ